jgi:glycosyltransferase involved in cell wall biosynthesis
VSLNVGTITRRLEGTINLQELSALKSFGAATVGVYAIALRAGCGGCFRIHLICGTTGCEDRLAELHVLRRSWRRPPDVVHVLYGDEQLDLLLRRRQLLSCPLVATFHLPPYQVRERFEETQKHLISGIDLAVVVARNQLQAFGNWLGADRVIYIPHGIDTDRFCPEERQSRRECVRLITVGHHMRDWKALDEIIDQCRARKLPVRFDIVALEQSQARPIFPTFTFTAGPPRST